MKYNLQEIMMYAVDGVKRQIEEVEETLYQLDLVEQTDQVFKDKLHCVGFLADLRERLEEWSKLDDWLSPWEEEEVEE